MLPLVLLVCFHMFSQTMGDHLLHCWSLFGLYSPPLPGVPWSEKDSPYTVLEDKFSLAGSAHLPFPVSLKLFVLLMKREPYGEAMSRCYRV